MLRAANSSSPSWKPKSFKIQSLAYALHRLGSANTERRARIKEDWPMAMPEQGKRAPRAPIKNLRWWIGGLLFASTVINYIDRQTLSNLAPFLKQDYGWTNTDYAYLVIAFRVAYSIGQTVCGRLVDKLGTRRGLTLSVIWYSAVSMLTSLAGGFYSFAAFRFLLGIGESANWPAATKAVSEWFPKRERGLATALFDSGSSIGGAIAPLIILP